MKEITVRTWTEKEYLTLREDSILVYWMKKERIIPLSQIVSFEVKDPKGPMRPGMIKIQLGGSSGSHVRLTSFLTVSDSGNVEFPHGYNYRGAAHEIKEYIANYKTGAAVVVSGVSPADEIKKYKELLDCGAITEDEFAAKKHQLLGL